MGTKFDHKGGLITGDIASFAGMTALKSLNLGGADSSEYSVDPNGLFKLDIIMARYIGNLNIEMWDDGYIIYIDKERRLRIECSNAKDKDFIVVEERFHKHNPFSGNGWLHQDRCELSREELVTFLKGQFPL